MVKRIVRILIIGFVSITVVQSLWSQRFRTESYRAYIEKHAGEAVSQMNRHSIPASVTMAQALVESGAGRSSLSRDFNNHFGIKCHSTWKGGKTYKNDDYRNECFRVYDNWEQSYEDHSIFLKQRRYRPLFSLDIYDYVGWSRGLQRSGYATNKGYANMLIAVIEGCELYLLDKGQLPSWVSTNREIKESNYGNYSVRKRAVNKTKVKYNNPMRATYISYGLLYVLAQDGDTFGIIAKEFEMDATDIAIYNDTPEDFPLKKGDVVYLQTKNSRATSKYPIYEVKVGDSMHSISQFFGIRLSALYELNNKSADYVPEEGDVLRLR